jgi:hypothetical protein
MCTVFYAVSVMADVMVLTYPQTSELQRGGSMAMHLTRSKVVRPNSRACYIACFGHSRLTQRHINFSTHLLTPPQAANVEV